MAWSDLIKSRRSTRFWADFGDSGNPKKDSDYKTGTATSSVEYLKHLKPRSGTGTNVNRGRTKLYLIGLLWQVLCSHKQKASIFACGRMHPKSNLTWSIYRSCLALSRQRRSLLAGPVAFKGIQDDTAFILMVNLEWQLYMNLKIHRHVRGGVFCNLLPWGSCIGVQRRCCRHRHCLSSSLPKLHFSACPRLWTRTYCVTV